MIYSVRFVNQDNKASHSSTDLEGNIFEGKRTPSSAYAILQLWGYEEWKEATFFQFYSQLSL